MNISPFSTHWKFIPFTHGSAVCSNLSRTGQDLNLSPGDLAITRPWQPHRLGLPNIGIDRLHWIIIDVGVRQPHQEWKWPDWLVIMPDDLAELTACLRENEQPIWPASDAIQDCFRQIDISMQSG